MGKKVLSFILASILILSSFSFAYGAPSYDYAERFKDEIFGDDGQGIDGLLGDERVVLGDIVDTYVSLNDPSLVTGIVRQFIGDTRYENYDFILDFVDENNNYVIDIERANVGGYIANDEPGNFESAFDNLSQFDSDLSADMTLEEMGTYFSKFSISLFFLNEAKSDGTLAGYESFMFTEGENGDLSLIESIFEAGGMYEEASTFIDRALETTFPPKEEAKQAALDLVERYNDSTQSDKEIVFDFMIRYNLVEEYTAPPSGGGGGGGGGALPPVVEEIEPFIIDIDYDVLIELIEAIDDSEEGRALLALSINEGEPDKAQVNISQKVLEETGYDEETALAIKYNNVKVVLSGDSFSELMDTQLSIIIEDNNQYTFESDNDLGGPVYISLPYDGESKYPSVFRYNEETEEYELIGGLYDEEEGVVRFAAKSFSQFMVGEADALSFTDLDEITWGQEYKDIVKSMSARGYIQGRGAEFDPFTEVTRAEFAAMLVRLLGITNVEGQDIFEDVNPDDWFYGEVAAAYDLNLIQGVSETEFKPNDNITREEMAVMAARMLRLKYYLNEGEAGTSFTDETLISEWALEGVTTVETLGIIEGRTSGEFDPKGLTTRLEALIVMERLLGK